jgi:glycerophosphoryl diester phosphodiesterase
MNTCVAHRGWSGKAPENTKAAFQLAIDHEAITAIELDVHLSKDGVPVVIHDDTLERTTNGSGRVADHTACQLQSLDAGSWFGPEFAGEGIPLLEEVLLMAKGRKKLFIELKQMGGCYAGLEEQVAGLIQKHGLLEEALIISFDHQSLRKLKAIDARLQTGLLFFGAPAMAAEQAAYAGASHVSFHHGFLTKELVDSLFAWSFEVGAWTVDDPESLERVKALSGEIHITTNHPDLMIEEPVRV